MRLCRASVAVAVKEICGLTRKRTRKRLGRLPDTSVVDAFKHALKARWLQGRTLVSVDECYFSERILPLFGYSPQGTPCVVTAPNASWKQRSLLLAVASDGSMYHRVIQGAANKAVFFNFVSELPYAKGAVLLLDNVAFHKDVKPFVAKGFEPLFTPPYSPEYNPVEHAFAKIKGAFRCLRGSDGACSVNQAIELAVAQLQGKDVLGMFQHLRGMLEEGTGEGHKGALGEA